MKNNNIFRLEMIGAIVIIFAGSGLHFLFELSGNFAPVALIAAVNESVWEHLKLAFWPMLIFGLVCYPYLKKHTANFWIAKAKALYVTPIVIVVMFYSYQAIFQSHNLAYDLVTFALAIIIGQYLSYWWMTRPPVSQSLKITALVAVIVLTVCFSLLTYFPPQQELFRDSVSGAYGIAD